MPPQWRCPATRRVFATPDAYWADRQQQQQQRGGAHGGALAHGGGLRHGGGARGVAESVRQRAARADAMRVAADSEDESDGGGAQCDKVIVQGAGTRAANGAYRFAGECDEVGKYALEVEGVQGDPVTFTLYRCKLNNGARRWYISVVPANLHPGTSQDIDYYSAPSRARHAASEFPEHVPPRQGWTTCKPAAQGAQPHPPHLPHPQDPPPYVSTDADDDSEDDAVIGVSPLAPGDDSHRQMSDDAVRAQRAAAAPPRRCIPPRAAARSAAAPPDAHAFLALVARRAQDLDPNAPLAYI